MIPYSVNKKVEDDFFSNVFKWQDVLRNSFNFMEVKGINPPINNQPFVFEKECLSFDNLFETDMLTYSPFPEFSLTVSDEPITQFSGESTPNKVMYLQSIFCIEKPNGMHDFIILISSPDTFNVGLLKSEDDSESGRELRTYIVGIVNSMFRDMNRNCKGVVTSRMKVKTKKGVYRPSDTIYVCKKAPIEERPKCTPEGLRIKHTNAWSVMSHWRRLKNPESMGLNRVGKRVVEGLTFVNSYEKGDGGMTKTMIRRVNKK